MQTREQSTHTGVCGGRGGHGNKLCVRACASKRARERERERVRVRRESICVRERGTHAGVCGRRGG